MDAYQMTHDTLLSPLGDLFQREAARMARRYPDVSARRLDAAIVLSLARVFEDAGVFELARATREGSLAAAHCPDHEVDAYALSLARRAVTLARRDRPQP